METLHRPRRQNPAQQTEIAEGNGLLFVAEHTQANCRSQVRTAGTGALRAHRRRPDEVLRDGLSFDRSIGAMPISPDAKIPALPSPKSPRRSNEAILKCPPPNLCNRESLANSLRRWHVSRTAAGNPK